MTDSARTVLQQAGGDLSFAGDLLQGAAAVGHQLRQVLAVPRELAEQFRCRQALALADEPAAPASAGEPFSLPGTWLEIDVEPVRSDTTSVNFSITAAMLWKHRETSSGRSSRST